MVATFHDEGRTNCEIIFDDGGDPGCG